MPFPKTYSTFAAVVLAVVMSACEAGPDQAAPESTESVQESLAAYHFGDWNSWTMPINVCFSKNTAPDCKCKPTGPSDNTCKCTPTDAQYTDLKALAMTGLQESWGQVPGVSFTNRGECTSSMTTYLHITIAWGPGWGGDCGVGMGATCNLGGGTANDNDKNFYKAVMGHEVGHALGLPHEHQRVDADNCFQKAVDACNRCRNAFDASQTCSAADWNLCVQPSPSVTTPQFFPKNSPGYNQVLNALSSGGPIPNLDLLTPYDPLSIMNYCAGKNGRDQYDYRPTAWDLLGVEMIYPANMNYRVGCKDACFSTGTGVITRTDGTVTTDWMARGALRVVIIDPKTGQDTTSLSATTLVAGSSQLTFKFRAPRNGSLLTTSGTLVNDNSVHTALVEVMVAANL